MRILTTFILSLSALVMSASAEQATKSPVKQPENYSCEMVTKVGGMETVSKTMVLDGKTRTETEVGGMKTIVITDKESKTALTIMPQQKMAMKAAMPEAAAMAEEAEENTTWKKVGEEGDLTIWESTTKTGDQEVKAKNWVNKDGHLVKQEVNAGGTVTTIEYKNMKEITAKDVDEDTFSMEAPEGYNLQDTTQK